jgi:hypothetical protein
MKEKTAVKTGIQFEKAVAFEMPISLTALANRMKATQDANKESPITGINNLKVNGVVIK